MLVCTQLSLVRLLSLTSLNLKPTGGHCPPRKGTKMNSIITGIKFVGLVGLFYASLIVLTALFITSWWTVDNGWLAFVGAGASLTGSVILLDEFLRG